MEFDAFSAGVKLGGLRSKQDIRVLICYLLSEIDVLIPMEDVVESLQTSKMVNYFEASEAFAELLETEKLSEVEDGIYNLSENGKLIAKEFENSLPQSVKDNSLLALKLHLERKKREKENLAVVQKTEYGYTVKCLVSGGNFDLFSFEIFAPDEICAEIIKDNFYKDPSEIYDTMLGALTKQI